MGSRNRFEVGIGFGAVLLELRHLLLLRGLGVLLRKLEQPHVLHPVSGEKYVFPGKSRSEIWMKI